MSDLVKRLRSLARFPAMGGCHMVDDETIDEAADKIEQLERELAEARDRVKQEMVLYANTAAERDAEKALADRLQDDLFGIEVYASDTISGPSEGVPDLKWCLDGIAELHDRALAGRAAYRKARGL